MSLNMDTIRTKRCLIFSVMADRFCRICHCSDVTEKEELNHESDNAAYLCSLTASHEPSSNIQKPDFCGQFTDCGNSQQLLKYEGLRGSASARQLQLAVVKAATLG